MSAPRPRRVVITLPERSILFRAACRYVEMRSLPQRRVVRRESGIDPCVERAGLVAAVEQSAGAIVITGTSGEIQYVNPAFTLMTGYSREEAAGKNPRILKSCLLYTSPSPRD